MNNDLISREALKKALNEMFDTVEVMLFDDIIATIDNAPTVTPTFGLFKEMLCSECEKRPQGEWVRKEDVIHSIAKQYSEHNELVPIWLSIGDIKGGAE